MVNFVGYRCSLCGKEYAPVTVIYTCPRDGGNLDVVLDSDACAASMSPEKLTASTRAVALALPAAAAGERPRRVKAPRCTPPDGRRSSGRRARQRSSACERLWVKDEGRNPTASFKDRASAVVVARARRSAPRWS